MEAGEGVSIMTSLYVKSSRGQVSRGLSLGLKLFTVSFAFHVALCTVYCSLFAIHVCPGAAEEEGAEETGPGGGGGGSCEEEVVKGERHETTLPNTGTTRGGNGQTGTRRETERRKESE